MISRFVRQTWTVGAVVVSALLLSGCGPEPLPGEIDPPPGSAPDDKMKVDLSPDGVVTDPLPGSDPAGRARRIRSANPGGDGSGCEPARSRGKVVLVTPGDRLGRAPLVVPACGDDPSPAVQTATLGPIVK